MKRNNASDNSTSTSSGRPARNVGGVSKVKAEVRNLLGQAPDGDAPKDGAATTPSSYRCVYNLKDLGGTSHSIHKFAREGNVKMVQEMLERFKPKLRDFVNSRDAEGLTALHYAARYNHLEVVRLLVEEGKADVNAHDSFNAAPLHFATRYRRQRHPSKAARLSMGMDVPDDGRLLEEENRPTAENCVILYLVSKGAMVNSKDTYQCTPLHYAAMRGNEVAAEQILTVPGVDMEAMDREKMRPVHHACSHGHAEIVTMLLQKGVNLMCRENTGCLPIHIVCSAGKIRLLELLLTNASGRKDGGSLVSNMLMEVDVAKNTPLHMAVKCSFVEGVALLLKNGADVNLANHLGVRPLHFAAHTGSLDVTHLLVSAGCLIDCPDVNLQTPLHWAAHRNHVEVLEYLVKNGADRERRDSDSQTPLLVAASNGKVEATEKLLALHASLMATQKTNKSALYLAAENNFPETASVLLRSAESGVLLEMPDSYNNTPLHIASRKGHVKMVKLLCDFHAKLTPKNEDVRTPLHYAAKYGRTAVIVQLLSQTAAHVHVNDEDEESNTPLHLAALKGHAMAATTLLEAGADIAVRNNKRWSAMDCAAAMGHVSVVEALLNHGCPVQPHDHTKITPLYHACQYGHVEVAELLLERDASVSILVVGDPADPTTGCNPLDAAIDNSHKECARAIIASPQWRTALRNQTRTMKGTITTPLRRLIVKMPDVAQEVFDRCMKSNGLPLEHPDYTVTCSYEFLDDTYASWGYLKAQREMKIEASRRTSKLKEQDSMADLVGVTFRGGEILKTGHLHGHQRELEQEDTFMDPDVLKNAQPYTKDSTQLLTNHPLMIMVRSKREELLSHPVVVTLLTLKWRSHGRQVYYINLLQYMIFLAFLTAYLVTNNPPFVYTHQYNINKSERMCPQLRAFPDFQSTSPTIGLMVMKYGVTAMAALAIAKEILQLCVSKLRYLDWENAIEWTIYVLSILTVTDISQCQVELSVREPWQWQIGSFSIFLAWMNLVLFLRKVPTFGIFVVMFTDILRTFLQFAVIFSLFIIAFSLAFHTLLENQEAFKDFPRALIKTAVMMTGELEYDAIFFSELGGQNHNYSVHYRGTTYAIFTIFLILVAVLIMNLLVGLAVDNIKGVQEHAALQRLAMLVELGLGVEAILPHCMRKRFLRRTQDIRPYAPIPLWRRIFGWRMFSEADEVYLQRYMEKEKSEFERLQDTQGDIRVQLAALETRLQRMEGNSERLLRTLKKMQFGSAPNTIDSRRRPMFTYEHGVSFDTDV